MSVSVILIAAGCAPSDEGPLSLGDGQSETGMRAMEGDIVGFGAHFATNTGASPITIVSVELDAGPQDGAARVLETWVTESTGEPALFTAGPWPGHIATRLNELDVVSGYVLESGSQAEFIFVLEIKEEGQSKWSGVTIEYTYDGTDHSASADNAFFNMPPLQFAISGTVYFVIDRSMGPGSHLRRGLPLPAMAA